ncbi:Putative zinc finger protein CONSTANS-LIKE 11 [Apostasia shenzhenica]|uniref:Zinc finger protein CONSTANS-LIKE 11 n=1 Tax=Apostasia shenzhenica TaxID=1088818 RepID=A0A2I0AUE2_9ASPA|nr:Putative zinc finger protein CONSTANS-LIKE 11 [Apostasia shenzhenica]
MEAGKGERAEDRCTMAVWMTRPVDPARTAVDPLCDFCGAETALVYCGADAARLCLLCDLYVHSANALSLRHFRAERIGPKNG